MSSSSSSGSDTTDISMGSSDMSNLWFSYSNVQLQLLYEKKFKYIIRGRKRYHCQYATQITQKEKKKALLHISEALNNCKDHPLVLLAANLSALKSLKETEVSEALQFLAELKNFAVFFLHPPALMFQAYVLPWCRPQDPKCRRSVHFLPILKHHKPASKAVSSRWLNISLCA